MENKGSKITIISTLSICKHLSARKGILFLLRILKAPKEHFKGVFSQFLEYSLSSSTTRTAQIEHSRH